MKLTINQLRHIIKEEVKKSVDEVTKRPVPDLMDAVYIFWGLAGNVDDDGTTDTTSMPGLTRQKVAANVLKMYGKTPQGYNDFVTELDEYLADDYETAAEVADDIWSPKYSK